ncbi:MAG: hypothetical protein SGILL_006963 [Bacillariaceae sp.]
MSTTTDDASWLLVKPIGRSHQAKAWGSNPMNTIDGKIDGIPTEIGTTSRLQRKVGPARRKGSFVEKNRKIEAPNLTSVISATPQMKKRAAVDARARYLKIEEYRKTKSSRTRVSRPPLKAPKKEWTNMITSSTHGNKPKKGFSAKKKKSKSTGDIAIADWKAAYQDILSPTSGNRRFVAKQDLTAPEKVTSPKKKVRGKTKAASVPTSTFPSMLPLSDDEEDDDDDDDDNNNSADRPMMKGKKDDTNLHLHSIGKNKGEEASVLSKASTRKTPLSISISDNDEEEEEAKSVKSSDSAATPNSSTFGRSNGVASRLPAMVSPIAEKDDAAEENDDVKDDAIVTEEEKAESFEDFDDFEDFTDNMEVDDDEDVPWEAPEVATVQEKDEDSIPAIREPQVSLTASQHTEKTPVEFAGVRAAEAEEEETQ